MKPGRRDSGSDCPERSSSTRGRTVTPPSASGKIDALAFPESTGELSRAVTFLRERGIPFLPVGNWTNLIVRDGGYRGPSCRWPVCMA